MKSALALLVGLVVSAACARATIERDVEYGRAGGQRLLLDVQVPDGAGPYPIAILVHGGGWSAGDKGGSTKPGDTADITPWFGPLTEAKFVWFSINYRLAPAHRWPACLDDVLTAIRWVKAHGGQFKGDPRHIALIGHSAGGQLVCTAACTAPEDARVQAVVGFAPVTDSEQDLAQRGGLSTSLQQLFGRPKEVTAQSLALIREFSPINHVRPGLPPFLLIHGDADRSVPYQQSLNFQAKLRAAGVPCELITIKGAPHSLMAWEKIDTSYKPRLVAWLLQRLGAGGLQRLGSGGGGPAPALDRH
jgi:alpha-L-fucosidase 2